MPARRTRRQRQQDDVQGQEMAVTNVEKSFLYVYIAFAANSDHGMTHRYDRCRSTGDWREGYNGPDV